MPRQIDRLTDSRPRLTVPGAGEGLQHSHLDRSTSDQVVDVNVLMADVSTNAPSARRMARKLTIARSNAKSSDRSKLGTGVVAFPPVGGSGFRGGDRSRARVADERSRRVLELHQTFRPATPSACRDVGSAGVLVAELGHLLAVQSHGLRGSHRGLMRPRGLPPFRLRGWVSMRPLRR